MIVYGESSAEYYGRLAAGWRAVAEDERESESTREVAGELAAERGEWAAEAR